jgi:hypothetical protein
MASEARNQYGGSLLGISIIFNYGKKYIQILLLLLGFIVAL